MRSEQRTAESFPARRGGVLFEVMLALALFTGAAAFTLASVRNVTHTLERSRLRLEAVDLARTRMAELEAGLITLAAVRGETDIGDPDERSASEADESGPPPWRIEVATSRSEFANLTLVEITVIENVPGDDEQSNPMRYTLRQLVALRGEDNQPFERDQLLDGLPADGGES